MCIQNQLNLNDTNFIDRMSLFISINIKKNHIEFRNWFFFMKDFSLFRFIRNNLFTEKILSISIKYLRGKYKFKSI